MIQTRYSVAVPLFCAVALFVMLGTAWAQAPDKAAATVSSPVLQQGPLWRSLMDFQPHRLGEEFEAVMASGPGSLRTPPPGPLTLPQAIENARARLSRDASASAIAGLRSSPTARTVPTLQGAAMAAVVAGKPAAALAAWLAAYDKEPRNLSVLVNLAGLLARMGMPTEALALLDAADALGAAVPAPAGLKGPAIALNTRGYALLLLRRWKEADALLRKAVALDPQLSEAALNLAYVVNQEGDKEEARRWFVMGVWRVRPQTITSGGAGSASGDASSNPFAGPGTNSLPSLGEMFDLSYGVPGRLPIFRHPTDLAQMESFEKMIKKYRELVRARNDKRDQRLAEISALLKQRPRSLSEKRSAAILRAIDFAFAQPDVLALKRQEIDAGGEWLRKGNEILQSVKDQREAIQNRFLAQWKGKWAKGPAYDASVLARAREIVAVGNEAITRLTPAWNHLEELVRKRLALRHRYMSAVVAQLGDPLWHERGTLLVLKDMERDFDSFLLMPIHTPYWQGTYLCTGFLEKKQPIDDDGEFTDDDGPSCNGAATIGVALGNTVSVSANCKSIGIEIGTEGWIGAFASVEYEFEGKVTVFAGPKAELGIEGLGTKVGMKDGLYITVDRKGVQDMGARIAFETSTTIAPGVSVATPLDSMDISIMNISLVPSVSDK